MPTAEPQSRSATRRFLCSGIAVIDQVFRVPYVPQGEGKTRAQAFASVVGGGAANAAIAITRLGGVAHYAGPLGDASGADPLGDQIVAALVAEGVDCSGCVRVDGANSPVSAVLIDPQGERTIIHHRAGALGETVPPRPERLLAAVDAVMADDHCPRFVTPVCIEARRRGLPVVLDIEKRVADAEPLFAAATHRIFSRTGLLISLGCDVASDENLAAALEQMARHDDAFYAVTDGARPVQWRCGSASGEVPVFPLEIVDTLAAGDVFHGAFALALLEGGDSVEALRFAAATAAIKCTRFGGGAVSPTREEVDRLLAASGEDGE
jgi:sugar/nucleoside kinase (ribokinase family)